MPSNMFMTATFLASLSALPILTHAHIAAFAKGMYCENGTDPSHPNFNSNTPVNPLYDLSLQDFWFQHDRGCDAVPPPPGVFLELPAGGEFTVELGTNQAFTSLSYGGSQVSDWPDGADHPEDWQGTSPGEGCIEEAGYMHVQNQSMAQGSAFAISYESDLSKVTLENLVVFSVLEHTPWKRLATYAVPQDLPACPEGGCTCAWLWVPKGCGQPNVYMQGFKCMVTGSTSTKKVASGRAPVYCEVDEGARVKGAKQMIVWNQKEGVGNVVGVPDVFLASPGYNERCGFKTGAQDDLFEDDTEGGTSASSTSSSASASETGGSSTLPVTDASVTATPTQTTPIADLSSSTSPSTSTDGSTGAGIEGPDSAPLSTSTTLPVSFTSTWTGRTGQPTKFTCYAEA